MSILLKIVSRLTLFLVIGAFTGNAQIGEPKSNTPSDSLSLVYEVANEYLLSDLDKAEQKFKQVLQLAIDKNRPFWQGKALYQLATIYKLKGGEDNFKESIMYGKLALANFRKEGDSLEVFNTLVHMNGIYIVNERAQEALKFALEARKLIPRLGNRLSASDKGKFYGNLALIYFELNLSQEAIEYNNEALEYFTTANNENGKYLIFNNLGILHTKNNSYDETYKNYRLAYKGFKKIKATRYLATVTSNLGNAAIKVDSIDLALKFLKEALILAHKNNYDDVKVSAQLFMGEAFFLRQQIDSANYFLDRTILDADAIGRVDRKADALEFKQKIAEERKDFKSAYSYGAQAKKLRDSMELMNNRTAAISTLLNSKENGSKKETNLISLKWVGLAAFVLILVFGYWKKTGTSRDTVHRVDEEKEKLSRKMVSLSALNVKRQQSLEEVADILDEIKTKISDMPSALQEEFLSAKKIVRGQVTLEKQWHTFFMHFEEVHPSFLKHLNENYNLSSADIKVCSFLKMNLSNYEMSEILGINQKSIHVIRHRLKKKLRLPANTTIGQFLSTI